MRPLVLTFALLIGFAPGALAQGAESTLDSFNRAMQAIPADGSPPQRLEGAVNALRASLAATEVIGSIIGDNRGIFDDKQLTRLARALLYKLAGDLLTSAGGMPLRLDADGRAAFERGRETISVRVVPQDRSLDALGAVVVTGRDQQGSNRIFDVVLEGESIVASERQALSELIKSLNNDPELTVKVVEDIVNGILSGL